MCKNAISLVRHYDHRASPKLEIKRRRSLSGFPLAEPERPFFSKRNCDNWRTWRHVGDAVTMRSDVMPKITVIPIHQKAVQTIINFVSAPRQQWREQCRDWKCTADLPAEVVIPSVRLLPTRNRHLAPVDFNFSVRLRMESPQIFKLTLCHQ